MQLVRNRLGCAVVAATLGVLVALCAPASRAVGAEAAAGGPVKVAPSSVAPMSAPEAGWLIKGRTPSVNGLRLRSGPGYGSTVKGLLYPNDMLMKTGKAATRGNWVRIKVLHRASRGGSPKGTVGWVHVGYTSPYVIASSNRELRGLR